MVKNKITIMFKFFFIFFCLISLIASVEDKRDFNYVPAIMNYANFSTNLLVGLSGGVIGLTMLKKINPDVFQRHRILPMSLYLGSVFFPLLLTGWRAKRLYNQLNYDYILENFESIKKYNFFYDKSAMIDDFKLVLLQKSIFDKKSINFNKYKVLLDILSSSPKQIIDSLNTTQEQQNFLSLVLLIDIDKNHKGRYDKLPTIKDAFEITSSFKNKKLSDSVFFKKPGTIKNFLDKVHFSVAARFIVEYQNDMEDLVKYFMHNNVDKMKNILCADSRKEYFLESSTLSSVSGKNRKPCETKTSNKPESECFVISNTIIFDFIIKSFIQNKDKSILFFAGSLSDQRFIELITYVFINEKLIDAKNLNIFFEVLQFFYQSKLKNVFLFKCRLLENKSLEKNILGWVLLKAGFTIKLSEKSSILTVVPSEKKHFNNDQIVTNNPSAQDRLTRLLGVVN